MRSSFKNTQILTFKAVNSTYGKNIVMKQGTILLLLDALSLVWQTIWCSLLKESTSKPFKMKINFSTLDLQGKSALMETCFVPVPWNMNQKY